MSLNRYGVKDASDCYRTIKGQRFVAWTSFPSAVAIKKYRAAGVRCRRFGNELFVHILDQSDAANAVKP